MLTGTRTPKTPTSLPPLVNQKVPFFVLTSPTLGPSSPYTKRDTLVILSPLLRNVKIPSGLIDDTKT